MRRAEPSTSFSTATNPPLASFGNLLERLAGQLHLTDAEEEPAVADSSLTNRRVRKSGRGSGVNFSGPQAAAFAAESARSADESGDLLADDYVELSYEQALRSHGRRHAAAEKIVAAPVGIADALGKVVTRASDPERQIPERLKTELAARDELPLGLPKKAGPRVSKAQIEPLPQTSHLGESLLIQSALAAVDATRKSLQREGAEGVLLLGNEVASERSTERVTKRLVQDAPKNSRGTSARTQNAEVSRVKRHASKTAGSKTFPEKVARPIERVEVVAKTKQLSTKAARLKGAPDPAKKAIVKGGPIDLLKQGKSRAKATRTQSLREQVPVTKRDSFLKNKRPEGRVTVDIAAKSVPNHAVNSMKRVARSNAEFAVTEAPGRMRSLVRVGGTRDGAQMSAGLRQAEVRVAGRTGAQRNGDASSAHSQANVSKTGLRRSAVAASLGDTLRSHAGPASRGTGSLKIAAKGVANAEINRNRAGMAKTGNLGERAGATGTTAALARNLGRRQGGNAQRDRGRVEASGRGLPDHRKVILSVRLSEDEVARLRVRSAESHVSVSMYIRSCVLEAERLRSQVREALSEIRARVEVVDGHQGSKSSNDGSDQAASPRKAAWFRTILKPAAMLTGALFPLSRRI